MVKWIVVGFKHPEEKKSIVYRQDLSDEALIEVIKLGIQKGCNIFSIRGFRE